MGAVELLEQHDPRELVRQRHRPEREPVVARVELACPNGAADHEADVAAALAALLQPAREATES